MNLSTKDKKILAELDLNARATFQELGKKCGTSKETTIYRVKQLEKKGIIERYTTLVDFGKLGRTGYAVYNRFQNVNEELKKEIVECLKKIPELYWIATIGGKFDLVFGLMCKNIVEFNKLYYSILTRYGEHLTDNLILIRTELRQHKRNYLTGEKPKEFKAPFFGKEIGIIELDELNEDIMSNMSNNARISVVELASKLNKPVSTITQRLKQLQKKEIIQGFTAYIRSQKYGFQSYRLLLFLQGMDENKRKRLFEYANLNPNMILAIEAVGEWNFEITLEVESHERLQKEISKLRSEFKEIKKLELLIMFEDDLVYDPYPLKKLERKNIKS